MYSNIRGLAANFAELTVVSANFDVLCLSETLFSARHHLSLSGDCRCTIYLVGLALYVQSGLSWPSDSPSLSDFATK